MQTAAVPPIVFGYHLEKLERAKGFRPSTLPLVNLRQNSNTGALSLTPCQFSAHSEKTDSIERQRWQFL
jgi:hypothetical protein